MKRLYRITFLTLLLLSPLSLAYAAGGTLSLWPQSEVEQVGKTFEVKVVADTGTENVNAAEGDLTYDPTALTVENISVDGSTLSSWATTPSYDSAKGEIRFSGWAAQSFSGGGNLLMTITFRPLHVAQNTVEFTSGAMLAQSGSSNILTEMQSGAYYAGPKAVAAPAPATSTPSTQPLSAPVLSTLNPVQEGNYIAVKGKANPNIKVSIFIQKDGETATEADLLSAADGSFAYISSAGAEVGVYYVWASASDSNGNISPISDKQQLTVSSSQAAAVISSGIELATVLVPFMAVLALLAFAVAYGMHRRSAVRHLGE